MMTFNIRNGLADDGPNSWPHRRPLTASVIRETSPDVIGLQEVFDFQLSYLLSELPEYQHYSVGRDDGREAGEHCSILWRRDKLVRVKAGTFWLSDTPDEPGSMTWGNRITRICSWVQFAEGFTLYNTHWDHESVPARTNSGTLFLDVLPSSPWILVGDFNAEPSWPEMQDLVSWSNAQFVTAENSVGTFHSFTGGTEGDKIDHIFTSPGLVCRDLVVDTFSDGGIFPSDHYPVSCTVTL